MKISVFLFLACIISMYAGNSYSQTTRLSLDLEEATVGEVLINIENQSEFYFLYSNKLVDINRKISLRAKNKPVSTILDHLFVDTDIMYVVFDRQIILSPEEMLKKTIEQQNAPPQEIVVTGKVTDADGNPLPGVNIVIKGTMTGTITNVDGNYRIEVEDPDAVLVFTFIGMLTQDIKVGVQTEINITMARDIIGLEEVVAIGYGTQERASLTGSVSSIKTDDLVVAPSTNTITSMTGRLPGLIVRQASGRPGDDVPIFNIRGFGIPLVIVDGTQRNFTQLDPNEIESISILKDESAAVYGARAGNGVILVTTRRGEIGAPKISYNSSYSNSRNTFYPEPVNAYQFATMLTQAEGGVSSTSSFSQEDIDKYREGTEPGYVSTNWQDLVMRDWAPQQQHNINVGGGNEIAKYFFNLGYLDQESIWKSGDGVYQRFNITSNIDVNISDKLSVKLDLNWRREDRDDPTEMWRIFRGLRFASPTLDMANFPSDDVVATSCATRPTEECPIAESTNDISGFIRDKRDIVNNSLSLNYELPIEGLSVDGKLVFSRLNRIRNQFLSAYEVFSYDYENDILSSEGFAWGGDNKITKNSYRTQRITTQLALRYSREFNGHAIKGLLLNERISEEGDSFWTERIGVISKTLPYLFAGSSEGQLNGDDVSQDGRASWVGRANYNYNGKYLAEFTFRYDGSPRFPEDKRWGFFPGVSLGWRISEESFLQDNDIIDNLKLRVSASRTGYDAISTFDYLSGYELTSDNMNITVLGDQTLAQLRTLGIANKNITWETIDLYNAGFDLSLLDYAIGVNLDVFYRKRSGILASRVATVSNTFGGQLPAENINSLDNRGFELELIHRKTIGDFSYNISGNLTWTRAKWIHHEERTEYENEDDARIYKLSGEWVNRTFGYLTDGFFNLQEEIENEPVDQDQGGNVTIEPGDVRYVDYNGDGVISVRDQVVIGKGTTPELMFGLNAQASYKGFDFSMLWQGAGNYIADFTNKDMIGGLRQSDVVPQTYQWEYQWNPDNPEKAKLPAPNLVGVKDHNMKRNDMWVKNANYLRLKTITLGYSLPQTLLHNTGIERVRIYASGLNLFTFCKLGVFENYDPEIVNNSLNTYPIQKVLSFGINITL